MLFAEALPLLKAGDKMTRKAWNRYPPEFSYVYISYFEGAPNFVLNNDYDDLSTWKINTRDILADDWELI